MNNATKNAMDILDMFADLEAALYREVQVHGDGADKELCAAVGYWSEKLAEDGLLGQFEFKATNHLLWQAGWAT